VGGDGLSVVVVGDVATDVVARLHGPLQLASDTGADVSSYGGGSAANVAAWLAGSGVPTTWVGRVGDDVAGRVLVEDLRRGGVVVRAAVDGDRPSACVVVLVTSDGERTMLADRGASGLLQPGDIAPDVFAPGSHLHLSGYPLLHEPSRAAARTALELAGAARMTVSVDASSAAPLRAIGAAEFLRWIAGVDLVLANRDEAVVLVGDGPAEQLSARLASTCRAAVVVKDGAGGAWWSNGTASAHAVAEPAIAVDTTGAGDAFAAGFLAAWLRHDEPTSALAAGARLAAVAVSRAGGRPPG
jgi:sugar/nucleoside kinase (ribokinase family)